MQISESVAAVLHLQYTYSWVLCPSPKMYMTEVCLNNQLTTPPHPAHPDSDMFILEIQSLENFTLMFNPLS